MNRIDMTVDSILENAYQCAEAREQVNSEFAEAQRNWIETIARAAESYKGVLAVLITSLVKKSVSPRQDVRYHKVALPNGYSGRGFDTKHVTPFLRKKFGRLAMKESGWLTRSLEQVHPYTLDFPGKIRDQSVKTSFLRILDDIEEHQADPKKYLQAIFTILIDSMEKTNIEFAQTSKVETVTIEHIMDLLKSHFSHDYNVVGASRLPVLAVYSAYTLLLDINRYKDKRLLPLKSHTTSDVKSGGIGDIEVVDKEGGFFEAVEIKHNIPITSDIVQDSYKKFADTAICRFYLLTTADPNVSVNDMNKVRFVVRQIRSEHGCEVIINGIVPSLRYYLRLLSNPNLFIDCYSKHLKLEYHQNTSIKKSHLRSWNELIAKHVQPHNIAP